MMIMLIVSISAPTMCEYRVALNIKYLRCNNKISSMNDKLMAYISFSILLFNETLMSHIVNKASIVLYV